MESKTKKLQKLFRHYKEVTGEREVDPKAALRWLVDHNLWVLPKPPDMLEQEARELSRALRDETLTDSTTGRPYRRNLSIVILQGDREVHRWFDIDEEKDRSKVHKSLIARREQAVDDVWRVNCDAEHWSNVNPGQASIQIPLDFTPDIEERKNLPGKNREAA